MTQEHRYSLTRVCLRRGELSLPRSLTGVFTEGAAVKAVDTGSGDEFELDLVGERVLTGMQGFFSEHELEVNDIIIIRPAADGSLNLTPQKRERKPDFSRLSADRIVDTVFDAAPVTEAEARALLPGLPADFQLASLLEQSGRLTLRAGRWHDASRMVDREFDRQVDDALAQAAAAQAEPRPATASGTVLPALEALEQVGFKVNSLGDGFHLLDAVQSGGSTGGFRVLAKFVQSDARLDWGSLLEKRRELSADYLSVFGSDEELAPLTAPAELAHATLWPQAAVEQLAVIAASLPLCPADLETHFRQGGMTGQAREQFEQQIQARIAERGAFSTVLANLSTYEGGASFQLEDAARGVDRDSAWQILDQLSRSPFQLVIRRDAGEYNLRANVQVALQQLAEYATSLQHQMPRAVTDPAQRRVTAGR